MNRVSIKNYETLKLSYDFASWRKPIMSSRRFGQGTARKLLVKTCVAKALLAVLQEVSMVLNGSSGRTGSTSTK